MEVSESISSNKRQVEILERKILNLQKKGKKLINHYSSLEYSNRRKLKKIKVLMDNYQDEIDEKRETLENELSEKMRISKKEQRTEIDKNRAQLNLQLE